MMLGRTVSGILSWFVVVVGMVSSAVAQEKPLTIETSTMQPSVVLGRPMLTWWDVKVKGSGLLTGQLQFFIKSDDLLLATLETEQLTLNGPQQRIRVMLPAVDPGYPLDRLNVDISFRGKGFSGKVSEQILRIPFSSKKVFVLLVGETKDARVRVSRDKTVERLRFENLVPETRNERNEIDDRELVKTFVASIDPVDFPSDAMAYCGYDVVALTGVEFRTLRKPQLEGLLTWVKSGGSLYVEPNGVLEPYHLEFLKDLAAESEQVLTFQPDATGRLPVDTLPPGRPAAVFGIGLGQAAIRIDDPDQEGDFTPAAWRPIIGPLWKLRKAPVPAPMTPYPAPGPNGQTIVKYFPSRDPWGLQAMSHTRFPLRHDELLDRLMPDDVQMVPTFILSLILFVFVVLIGPGDYYVLGWLRARSLTWLTFPVAAVAVTALTVWISNWYMSQAETRRSVVLRDVGPSGDIVRTNRIELLFVAFSHRITSEIQKTMFVPLALNTALSNNPFMPPAPFRRAQPRGFATANVNQNSPDDEPQFELRMTPYQGRIPTQFSVSQDLVKWTPQLNRLFSIPGTGSHPEIDWSEFELSLAEIDPIRQHVLPPMLVDRVHRQFKPAAMVACFYGKDGWAYDRSAGWNSSRAMADSESARFRRTFPGTFGMSASQAFGEAELFRWILQASVAPPESLFMLTSHTSPKGGRTCDDLLLLDTSDPKSWLLVVVVPENGEFTVYRKLMRIRD